MNNNQELVQTENKPKAAMKQVQCADCLKWIDDAAAAAAGDRVLTIAAEICVQACIKCKTKGSKWLDIVSETDTETGGLS